MKKFYSVILVCLLVFLSVTPMVSASALATPIIKINVAEGVAGDTIIVDISAENNPGIIAMGLSIVFDNTRLALVDATNGEVFNNNTAMFGGNFTVNPYNMLWEDGSSRDNIKSNGLLAKLTFKIIDGAPTGDALISAVYNEDDVFNIDGENVAFSVKSGKITVHEFSTEWTIDKIANCVTTGSKSHHCTHCDMLADVTEIPLDTGNHNFSTEWTVDIPVICTSNGIKSHHCTRCDAKTDITVIPNETPTNHNYSTEWTVDIVPTCVSAGSKSHHCTRCDAKDCVTVIPIDNTKHNFDSVWTVDTPATCITQGSKSHHCTLCDVKGSVTAIAIDSTKHNFSTAWTVDKKATYTEKGSKSHHCTRCAAKSDVTAIAIVKLPAPKLTSAANTSTGITVKWGKVTAATGYIIYRKAGSASSWTKLATVSGVSTVSYTDKSVKSGTVYKYTVRAINSVNSGYYNTTGISVKCLSMPKVTLANAAKAVTVKWNKIAGATGYIVYRKAGTAKSWTKVATISKNSTVTYTDKNVKSGTNYIYTVKAYYGKVYSAYNTKGVAIKFIAPTVLNSAVSGKTGITLKYTKVSAGTGYVIYRKSTGGYSKLATVSGNTKVTYLDKTAKKGVTYTYVVRAYNGKFMSANSNAKACKDKY